MYKQIIKKCEINHISELPPFCTSTSQMIIFREPDEDEENCKENKSSQEELEYGTIFEVDPVLAADEFTIDLNLNLNLNRQLEHDTAPPSRILGGEKLGNHRLLLHRKVLLLQLTLKDGNNILVGNWKPTGDPRFEKNDIGHVIFINASIQRLSKYQ